MSVPDDPAAFSVTSFIDVTRSKGFRHLPVEVFFFIALRPDHLLEFS